MKLTLIGKRNLDQGVWLNSLATPWQDFDQQLIGRLQGRATNETEGLSLEYSAESSIQFYLVGCFVIGLLLVTKRLVQIAVPQFQSPRLLQLATHVSVVILAFILTVDHLASRMSIGSASAPSLLLDFGLATSLVGVHILSSTLQLRRGQLVFQPVAWLAVALTLAATGWSAHRYNVLNLQIEMDKSFEFVDGELDTLDNLVAVTDRGREVALYQLVRNGVAVSDFAESQRLKSNCHGGVFTSGQHMLWRDGVDRILEDNGYQVCSVPQAGDLIIYRNATGEILHTGQVKLAVLNGVMIESKWGLGKWFLHDPAMQPYSSRYDYYRSSRHGHALTIRPARSATSPAPAADQ